ncbi:MAG: sigma-54 dependent transcriptional regulator, partial [Prevotellaceae bacterium]|nr:sigma-54 dependent transcriptional regulator [Prevotellaceae bacterium]
GKELIAEALHANSARSANPFVKVNLGGISQSLFESEMFGHKKGAFTDAHADRVGRFEMADKGSIFLDEIGELDPTSQVKLLRVLQDQTFEPLGDSRQRQVDTRIISATNRNLAEMVQQGAFREDLFYRINLITVHMPALRERTEDIPALVAHFIRLHGVDCHCGLDPQSPDYEIAGQARNDSKNDKVEVSSDAIDFLRKLPYPGNIRELKNLVDRTLLVSGKSLLTAADFKAQYVELPAGAPPPAATVGSLELTERDMILKAIERYSGNRSKVATALGLTRQALYRRLEKYDIQLRVEN